MLSLNTRQAYSEVDEFLELLDENFKNKVPENFRNFLKKEKDINYKKNIKPKLPIVEQNLKRETLAIIAFINLQYWCLSFFFSIFVKCVLYLNWRFKKKIRSVDNKIKKIN